MGGVGSGPPHEYQREDGETVIALMRNGETSLSSALQHVGMGKGTFYLLLERFPDLHADYEAVRPIVAHSFAEKGIAAVERAWDTVLDDKVDAKRANAVASAGRNLADRYAWMASRIDPATWGDKVQHSGAIEHRAVVLLPQLVAAPAVTAPTVRATLAAGDDGNAPARQDGRAAAELTAPGDAGELSTS